MKVNVNSTDNQLDTIKKVFEDGFAEINGTQYKFTAINHIERRKVFAFFTKIKSDLQKEDFSFLSTNEWNEIEKFINTIVLVNNQSINKIPNYWDTKSEDYLMFISIALLVISYPFLKGTITN